MITLTLPQNKETNKNQSMFQYLEDLLSIKNSQTFSLTALYKNNNEITSPKDKRFK